MYTGSERRHPDSGIRTSDRDFCALHHVLQEEKKESRDLVCGKIKSLKTEHDMDILRVDGDIDKVDKKLDQIYSKIDTFKDLIVGKYWFRIIIGGLCVAMSYIGYQQNWAFSKILSNQQEFSIQLNVVENNQIVITEKVRQLEEAHHSQIKGDKTYGN
jgi:hypothetical protein